MTTPLLIFDQHGVSNELWSDTHAAVLQAISDSDDNDRVRFYRHGDEDSFTHPMTRAEAVEYVRDHHLAALGPLRRVFDDAGEPIPMASPYRKGPVWWLRVEGGYRLYYADDKSALELRVVKTPVDAYNASVAEGFRAWRWAPEVCAPRDMTDQPIGGRQR